MIKAVIVLELRHPNIISSLGRIHPDKNRRDVCATREELKAEQKKRRATSASHAVPPRPRF
jgi:hypothetical protein